MKSMSLIKIEALTLSKKILDQIESHPYDRVMETCIIGWYMDNGCLYVISKIGGRIFMAHNDRNPETTKERHQQIFIK